MKDLRRITVVGLGLLGGSISLAVLRSFPRARVVGYAHRGSTRALAEGLLVATEVTGSLSVAVADSDLVILATPIGVFENILESRKHLGRRAADEREKRDERDRQRNRRA